MSRSLWILLSLVISTSVYFTIRYGLRPKPIPVLNPTEFAQLPQIGVVIYKRLHQNIRSERVVVLGVGEEARKFESVWQGLADSALADKEYLVVFAREGMKALAPSPNAEVVPYTDAQVQSGEMFEEVARRIQRKQLVVVQAWTSEATHLVQNSISQKLEKAVHHPVLAISATNFAVDEADVSDLQPQCLDASPGADELKKLKCAAYKVARKFLKKRLDKSKFWAAAERHGLKEFLVFIHQP